MEKASQKLCESSSEEINPVGQWIPNLCVMSKFRDNVCVQDACNLVTESCSTEIAELFRQLVLHMKLVNPSTFQVINNLDLLWVTTEFIRQGCVGPRKFDMQESLPPQTQMNLKFIDSTSFAKKQELTEETPPKLDTLIRLWSTFESGTGQELVVILKKLKTNLGKFKTVATSQNIKKLEGTHKSQLLQDLLSLEQTSAELRLRMDRNS
eukprot:TRINITY_DN24609_c0_g2_i2.p1 TRINITY_DN24609_c0_g2~~TRINITY_DN24609_c0_g2_i2.p1  ORF type:complete len:209 (-),score=51.77 TRINITY_DN24609_c0_g2_i2:43-669(-)